MGWIKMSTRIRNLQLAVTALLLLGFAGFASAQEPREHWYTFNVGAGFSPLVGQVSDRKPAPAVTFQPLFSRSLTCPTSGLNPAPTLNLYHCSRGSCALANTANPNRRRPVTA